MLGLDAISLPFISDNIRELPTFGRLLESGALSYPSTPATYMSASVWPTFSTGKPPGEHGRYFPFQWCAKERRYRRPAEPSWSDDFDTEPFWHRVARAGVPTIAFDIADVLHDERAPCLQITNWSYQSSGAARASHPEVLRELQRRFGRRPIGSEVPVPKTARQCAAIRDSLIRAVRAKADATLYLMEKPWGLFVTAWYEAHRAGHNLWPVDGDFASDAAPDAMLEVYREIDRQLDRLLAALERQEAETSLLLFSLHGMGASRVQDHFLAEILARLNSRYLGGASKRSSQPAPLNATAFLRRALPPTLQYWAASILGERVQDWVVNRTLTAGRDWVNTPGFPLLSGGEGFVRLNIKRRESPGFFEAGSPELTDYVAWLSERLMRIRVSETDQPLIRKIAATDAQFPGARRRFLPDLVLQWAPDAPAERIDSPDIGEIHVSLATGRGGNHNDSAFLIAKGSEALLAAVEPVRDISDIGAAAEAFLLHGNPARRMSAAN